MAHPAGGLPASDLSAAFEQWSRCKDWHPEKLLAGAITENNRMSSQTWDSFN
jgi:hypothetical protein